MSLAPPSTPSRPRQRSRGYILLESLICLAVIGIGAMPLAVLGPLWLRLAGEQESLAQTTLWASEFAETAGAASTVPPGAHHAQLCGKLSAASGPQPLCAPGVRLVLAGPVRTAPDTSPGMAVPPAHVALWVAP
ncbi:type II secretion system protein [Cupriavidus sp. 2KB_3]|uniref:type II secretion system protein n=1 Tax=Cupriavidus TaxID=106589 RepID=UPI0011F05689|nr:type II secretion system protein [Cupriavidus campinensis]